MGDGKIYFVAAPGRIKIGYTRRPDKRLVELQNADMERLTVIAVAPGSARDERNLHKLSAAHRISGEWFLDCADIRSLIADYVSGKIEPIREEPKLAATVKPASAPLEVRNPFFEMHSVRTAAIAEAESLLMEIQKKMWRGEPTSDLVRAACFLANHVIAPSLKGKDHE